MPDGKLNVVPRLQENEITSAAIATARECLRVANAAATVCDGVDILNEFSNDVRGPQEAEKFLDRVTRDPSIPAVFFEELAALKANASLSPKKPSVKAEKKLRAVHHLLLGRQLTTANHRPLRWSSHLTKVLAWHPPRQRRSRHRSQQAGRGGLLTQGSLY